MTNQAFNSPGGERRLFAELKTGSRLYGTATPDSDEDTFLLLWPTPRDLTRNQRVSFPQRIENGRDVRPMLFGDFVLTLGRTVERSLTALHYPELFGELQDAWLCTDFLYDVLTQAKNMWDNAKNDKQRAHAYRLWQAYCDLCNGVTRRLYPMPDHQVQTYQQIREGANISFDWMPTTRLDRVRRGSVNTDALADWVWAKYKEGV